MVGVLNNIGTHVSCMGNHGKYIYLFRISLTTKSRATCMEQGLPVVFWERIFSIVLVFRNL